MRILDLDLDCFINRIIHSPKPNGERPDDTAHYSWSKSKFRNFIEKQCGLSKDQPLKGKIFNEHIEAFYYWRELVESKSITDSFQVVHVDAHADLGYADSSFIYLASDILLKGPNERHYPIDDKKHLTSANYLAFALACRWINKLTFVHHERWNYTDLVPFYFKDFNHLGNSIQMKGYALNVAKNLNTSMGNYGNPTPLCIEAEIPFEPISVKKYKTNTKFDFATICKSPRFTPKSADSLIDIFSEYICL